MIRTMLSRRRLGLSILAAASTRRASALSSPLSTTAAASTNVCNARFLGKSDLIVSEACLGTMTFGVQNNQQEAFEQLDFARSRGCNFIDTAELYPVPVNAPEWRAGATEEIVGEYIAKIGEAQRDQLVIATKICGYSPSSSVAAARSYPNAPIVSFAGLQTGQNICEGGDACIIASSQHRPYRSHASALAR